MLWGIAPETSSENEEIQNEVKTHHGLHSARAMQGCTP
jgi:hypothetical protein